MYFKYSQDDVAREAPAPNNSSTEEVDKTVHFPAPARGLPIAQIPASLSYAFFPLRKQLEGESCEPLQAAEWSGFRKLVATVEWYKHQSIFTQYTYRHPQETPKGLKDLRDPHTA